MDGYGCHFATLWEYKFVIQKKVCHPVPGVFHNSNIGAGKNVTLSSF